MVEPAAEETPDVPAQNVFAASLEPRPGGRLLRSTRLAAAFLTELAWGLPPGPSLSDVVVTRRSDGAELVRVPAGDPLVPGDLLAWSGASSTSSHRPPSWPSGPRPSRAEMPRPGLLR